MVEWDAPVTATSMGDAAGAPGALAPAPALAAEADAAMTPSTGILLNQESKREPRRARASSSAVVFIFGKAATFAALLSTVVVVGKTDEES